MLIQLDAWKISVDWTKMYYGHSFFVPSINWKDDKKSLQAAADAVGCEIGIKGVIEGDVRGIRVWVLRAVI